jgi:hypothetical protein
MYTTSQVNGTFQLGTTLVIERPQIPHQPISYLDILERDTTMRNTAILLTSAALLASIAPIGSAIARDRSDRTELTASQMTDRADVRTARLKVELNLTAEQEKNWSGFATAMQDTNRKQADRRIGLRDARAQQHGTVDALDEMRKRADSQIERSNDLKKLADAAQPLYASLDEQQKSRFAEILFAGNRERDAR